MSLYMAEAGVGSTARSSGADELALVVDVDELCVLEHPA